MLGALIASTYVPTVPSQAEEMFFVSSLGGTRDPKGQCFDRTGQVGGQGRSQGGFSVHYYINDAANTDIELDTVENLTNFCYPISKGICMF